MDNKLVSYYCKLPQYLAKGENEYYSTETGKACRR
jgi:hypothetical protein